MWFRIFGRFGGGHSPKSGLSVGRVWGYGIEGCCGFDLAECQNYAIIYSDDALQEFRWSDAMVSWGLFFLFLECKWHKNCLPVVVHEGYRWRLCILFLSNLLP